MRLKFLSPVFAITLGCASYDLEVKPNQTHKDFFFSLTEDSQKRIFQQYNIQTKYELVIIGNQLVHPPQLYLLDEFSEMGEDAIPFLRDKLSRTRKEMTILVIIEIFERMQRNGRYEVSNDEELMRLAGTRVEGMEGQWKQMTERIFQRIKAVPATFFVKAFSAETFTPITADDIACKSDYAFRVDDLDVSFSKAFTIDVPQNDLLFENSQVRARIILGKKNILIDSSGVINVEGKFKQVDPQDMSERLIKLKDSGHDLSCPVECPTRCTCVGLPRSFP